MPAYSAATNGELGRDSLLRMLGALIKREVFSMLKYRPPRRLKDTPLKRLFSLLLISVICALHMADMASDGKNDDQYVRKSQQ